MTEVEKLKEQVERLTKEREYLLGRAGLELKMSYSLHNWVTGCQSALIESMQTSEQRGLIWIRNALLGPGFLMPVYEAVENDISAQAHFDTHSEMYLTAEEANALAEISMTKELSKPGSTQPRKRHSLAPFSLRMLREIKANEAKGDWSEWKPNKEQLLSEINHHCSKLKTALEEGNHSEVAEYAADIANYCMKAYENYGGEVKHA